MATNYNSGDDALVYIRRAIGEGLNGIIPQYDYYLMTSLPTNDNPRYSIGNNNNKQNIISSYYHKFDLGPCDIKVQTGPYPKVSGDFSDSTKIFSPRIAVEVKLGTGELDPSFRHVISTDPENTVFQAIPYRNYKLGYSNADVAPYYSNDFIRYTGIPTFRFKQMPLDQPNAVNVSKTQFDKLKDLFSGIVSGVPGIVQQSGTFKLAPKDFPQETISRNYILSYQPSSVYIPIDTQQLNVDGFNYDNCIILDPDPNPAKTFNPYPNHVVHVTGIVSNDTNGLIVGFGPPEVKRREAGSQLHKISLLNFYNRDAYGPSFCKGTQIAYKVGIAANYTKKRVWEPTGIATNTDTKIFWDKTDVAPAAYVFYASNNAYPRLPECWPWSCRRWTVEKKVDPSDDTKMIVKYYTQDASGIKKETSLSSIPKMNISLSSFTGHKKDVSPYFLNMDPLSTISLPNSKNEDVPATPDSYLTGYNIIRLEIPVGDLDDEQIAQCGCNPNDEKIELAAETFPLMDRATCKYIIKLGFLCYTKKNCSPPNVGVAYKKIIYPFNSCRFNEKFEIDLEKLKFPDQDFTDTAIIFSATPKTSVSYVFTSGIKPITTDPYSHPSGITVGIDGGTTIDLAGESGFLSISARYPCKYTSNIHTYKVDNEGIQLKDIYMLNNIHDCPTQQLAKITLQGNGTDENSEDPDEVITGGDYYFKDGNRTFWNKCDLPKQDEIYLSKSLGNLSYMQNQSHCCSYCKYADDNKNNIFKPFPECSAADIEATSGSTEQLEIPGKDCKMEIKLPPDECRVRKKIGKAVLKVKSTVVAQTIEEVFFNVEGDLVQPIDSFIRIYPTGVDNQMLTHIHANAYVSGVDPYIKISGVADVMPIESEFKFGPTWIIDSSGIKYEF